MRGVTRHPQHTRCYGTFLLTRLMRGVTRALPSFCDLMLISTHTPHARRDGKQRRLWADWDKFLLTRLMRGVTWKIYIVPTMWGFLLTRLMRGVTFFYLVLCPDSIKFLLTRLMRGVTSPPCRKNQRRQFLLTRLMRGVTHQRARIRRNNWFLLTRLMRGVTENGENMTYQDWNFYSHASCEAWPVPYRVKPRRKRISTHTPHARRDPHNATFSQSRGQFLLTRLMRGVTFHICYYFFIYSISTHTPHARRDGGVPTGLTQNVNFYSHASCEAWQKQLDD